jgi:hypothetical protein
MEGKSQGPHRDPPESSSQTNSLLTFRPSFAPLIQHQRLCQVDIRLRSQVCQAQEEVQGPETGKYFLIKPLPGVHEGGRPVGDPELETPEAGAVAQVI